MRIDASRQREVLQRRKAVVGSNDVRQTVGHRIEQLRKCAANEPDPWTRTLLSRAAAAFEGMLAANDPLLFSLPIALEPMGARQGTLH